jgi:7-cyano-7-deazaguanine tRNA-ribosyltransferase
LIPLEISDIYPAAHYVMSCSEEPEAFTEFATTWSLFLKHNNFRTIHAANDEFLKHHAKGGKKTVKFFNFKSSPDRGNKRSRN